METGVVLVAVADFVVIVSLGLFAVTEVRVAGLMSPFVVGFLAPAEVRCAGLMSPFVRGFFSAVFAGFVAETLGFVAVAESVDVFVVVTGAVFVAGGLDVDVLVVGVKGFLAPTSYKQLISSEIKK